MNKYVKNKYNITGGMEPTVNPDWCDGNHSQCMDIFQTCQKGGSTKWYNKYKKYKYKYNNIKQYNNYININDR